MHRVSDTFAKIKLIKLDRTLYFLLYIHSIENRRKIGTLKYKTFMDINTAMKCAGWCNGVPEDGFVTNGMKTQERF